MACEADGNPYVRELCQSLGEQGVTVDLGLGEFWLKQSDYDIVHIQWPEALFQWKNILWSDIKPLFRDVLPEWRNSARILVTRHNETPHQSSNKHWMYLYDHIYDNVDGVVHLGAVGVDKFKTRFAERIKYHSIIPHPVYSAYGEALDKLASRRRLHISRERNVVLAFGALRHDPERRLLQTAFSMADIPWKILVAPRFGQCLRPSEGGILNRIRWELKHRELLWPRQLILDNAFVPDDMVKVFFAAADVVIIPRLNVLNSGVVPLAIQYGKVVIGPNVGNIGEILRATGNPTFDPSSVESCSSAIEEAFRLAEAGLGLENARYAEEHWAKDKTARMHVKFYESMLEVQQEHSISHQSSSLCTTVRNIHAVSLKRLRSMI
jgi:hypothetical protein